MNTSSGTYFYGKKGVMTSILPLDFDISKYEEEDGPKLWAFRETFIDSGNISIKPEKANKTKYNYIIGKPDTGSLVFRILFPASSLPLKPCSGQNTLTIFIPEFNKLSTRCVLLI